MFIRPKYLNYFVVNQILDNLHPNLSGYWSSMGFSEDKTESYVTYEISDGGPDETATVKWDGTVIASNRLIQEMNDIG
jgi:hypothetical protein